MPFSAVFLRQRKSSSFENALKNKIIRRLNETKIEKEIQHTCYYFGRERITAWPELRKRGNRF
jgi:hypothetical protein